MKDLNAMSAEERKVYARSLLTEQYLNILEVYGRAEAMIYMLDVAAIAEDMVRCAIITTDELKPKGRHGERG